MRMPVTNAGGGGAESGWVYRPLVGSVQSVASTTTTATGDYSQDAARVRAPLSGSARAGPTGRRPLWPPTDATRPADRSALEYACHTRDSFALYAHRIDVVLAEDRPLLPRMRRDEVVVERDYNSQNPAAVAEELAVAAEALAARLESVPPQAWVRVGVRDNLEMSIDWMARNVVHEGTHHLVDVGRALRAARRANP